MCDGMDFQCKGANKSRVIILDYKPTPVLAEHLMLLLQSRPIVDSTSCLTLSGSAAGKSILFITGIISRLLSMAKLAVHYNTTGLDLKQQMQLHYYHELTIHWP